MIVGRWPCFRTSMLEQVVTSRDGAPGMPSKYVSHRTGERAKSPYIVVCSAELFDRVSPDTRVNGAGTKEFQGVVDVDLCPLWQQLFHSLLNFGRVSPGDGLEELGEAALISRQVEPELPDQVLFFRRERLTGCIIEDNLAELADQRVAGDEEM